MGQVRSKFETKSFWAIMVGLSTRYTRNSPEYVAPLDAISVSQYPLAASQNGLRGSERLRGRRATPAGMRHHALAEGRKNQRRPRVVAIISVGQSQQK